MTAGKTAMMYGGRWMREVNRAIDWREGPYGID